MRALRVLHNEASLRRANELAEAAAEKAHTLAYIDTVRNLGRVNLPQQAQSDEETARSPHLTDPNATDSRVARSAARHEQVTHIADTVRTDPRIARTIISNAKEEFLKERELGLHNDPKSSKPGLTIATRTSFATGAYANYLEEYPEDKFLDAPLEIRLGEDVLIFRLNDGLFEEVEVETDDGLVKQLKLIIDGATQEGDETQINPNPTQVIEGIDFSEVIRIVSDSGELWQNPAMDPALTLN